MSINLYGVEDDNEVIYPIRLSSTLTPDIHVDLLMFKHDGAQHYTTIRDFSRLLGKQLRNHWHTIHCCRRCLHAYSGQELLDAHALDCCHVQKTKFPKDMRCRFTNIQKQLLAPFVVYADLESILQWAGDDEAMDTTQGVAVGGDEPTAASGHFQEHLPCSFAYKVVSTVAPDFSRPLVSYRGDVCGQTARGSRSVVSGVHCYCPTNARAYRGRVALLSHCRQLSHMQPAAGRANNLYGWAMSQPLPIGGFRFLRLDEIEALAPVGGTIRQCRRRIHI